MRQLFPSVIDNVDLYDAYRVAPGKPFVRVDMVMSADGRATDREGRSGGLGGEADREVFRTMRAQADGIMVGAGTARKENYGPHKLREDLAARRAADGRTHPAPIVVVTRSLDLDFSTPLFTEAQVPTIVLTCESSPADRRDQAAAAGAVIVAGDTDVDLVEGVRALREDFGITHLLCEGGPSLNEPLFNSGLVNELALTLAPMLIGASHKAILEGLHATTPLQLTQVIEADSELLLRYTVSNSG